MKIIVADELPASALEVLRADGWIVDSRTGRSPKDLSVDLADADAILVRSATKIDAQLIAAARAADHRARGVGVDNVDVDAASARGSSSSTPRAQNCAPASRNARRSSAALSRAAGRRSRDESGKWKEPARHRSPWKDARHRGIRPDQPGSRRAPRLPAARRHARSVYFHKIWRRDQHVSSRLVDELLRVG